MINSIWAAFFLIAAVSALAHALFLGDSSVFGAMVTAAFDMSKTAFDISLGLTGMLCLWLGFMRVGEQGGAVQRLSRAFEPLLLRLFPGIPKGHPALGAMMMNFAANMLGLDNAATPLGLKAMAELQSLNEESDRATDAQVLFLVINTASITLVPSTLFVFRAQMGALEPTDIYLPLLIASFIATLSGVLFTALFQPIGLKDPVVLAFFGGLTATIGGMTLYFTSLEKDRLQAQSSLIAHGLVLSILVAFLLMALMKRVPVYEAFVEGAKQGFHVSLSILPNLVAMLVAIGVLRASGALDILLEGVRWLVLSAGIDARWVDALPTGLMRPLSGSGARGLMLEVMKTQGADSFAGRLVCLLQGSSETTLYVLAVYFGSVGIKKERHALVCGLVADLVGLIASIGLCYVFFG